MSFSLFPYALLLMAFSMLGCATPSYKPLVTKEFQNKYKTAMMQDQPQQACDLFRSLQNSHEQSLVNEIIQVRIFEKCSEFEDLPTPTIRPEIEKGMQDALVSGQQKTAQRKLQTQHIVSADKLSAQKTLTAASILQARMEKNPQKRESLYKKAVELAKATQDQELINQTQTAFKKNSPRLFPFKTDDEKLLVGNDYRLWREFKKAAQIYESIIQSDTASSDLRLLAAKNLRINYKTEQNKVKYIDASKKLWQLSERLKMPSSVQLELLLTYSRTLWTEDQAAAAEKLLLKNGPLLDGKTSLHELYWVLAKINEERKNIPETLKYLELSLLEFSKYPNKRQDFKDKILWTKAWFLWKAEDIASAEKIFYQLTQESLDPSAQIRSLYWLAKAQSFLQKNSESQETLRTLRKKDPLGYYGLLTYAETGELIPPLESKGYDSSGLQHLPDETRAFIELGESVAAERSLNDLVVSQKNQSPTNSEKWKSLFLGYAHAGLFMPLFASLTQLPAEMKDQFLSENPDFVFPSPWKSEVIASANQTGVPAEMIYAIMRQESAFNPFARSQVDAFGLMQLLPPIASKLSKKYQVPYSNPQDLFEPKTIIQLGAYELKEGFARTKGSWIQTVAGYNAAASAVDSWLKTKSKIDGIHFIEDIPYDETRTYLKLVLRNQIFYRRMFTNEAFPFPKDLLEIAPVSK